MKVLMFGWEFPPFASGGLGTACHGLTKGLTNQGIGITFVIPKSNSDDNDSHVDLIVSNRLKIDRSDLKMIKVDSILKPYINQYGYEDLLHSKKVKLAQFGRKGFDETIYGNNLFDEVYRYSEVAKTIGKYENFDVIHCHDWMTFKAGINAKEVSNKPLVIHVHATEFDRTGGNPNQYVYELEKEGFNNADKIIAVSNYTKNKVTAHYGIDPNKVEVVHNAVEFDTHHDTNESFGINQNDKIVLFLGRITIQKGPDYFIYAAKKVLEHMDNVKFVVAGSGDMEAFMIEKAAELGISDKVLFAGFLKGNDINKAYRMADLYVMPSISEPFGITPLESLKNNTPVIISKQSGVSEVLNHCLKIDFWDIDQIANKIISVLKYQELSDELTKNGSDEVRKFDWNIPANKCINVYNQLTRGYI